jgi:vitamin B12/bleomycin/antimicrobial peptide transport system ATP-binding/permease protein
MRVLHQMVLPASQLNAFNGVTYTIFSVILTLILAPGFFKGDIQIGDVTRSQAAFFYVLSSFTWIANNFESLSLLAVVTERLGQLQAFSQPQAVVISPSAGGHITMKEADGFNLQQVTLQTPDRQRTLVQDLCLDVRQGEALLITGESGKGKSSLVRALAGLWTAGSGCIIRPNLAEILFLPQRPYFVLGSLREQLVYPQEHADDNSQILILISQLRKLSKVLLGFQNLNLSITNPGSLKLLANSCLHFLVKIRVICVSNNTVRTLINSAQIGLKSSLISTMSKKVLLEFNIRH